MNHHDQDELQQARRQHQELIDSIEGIVWEADAHNFAFTFVSQWAERLRDLVQLIREEGQVRRLRGVMVDITRQKRAEAETILVVEDEEAIRRLMRACLEQGGYQVLSAADGAEALKLLAEPTTAVDLLLLDLNLPERSGREVLEELRRRSWDRPVIVFSGQLTPEIQAALSPLGVSGFLAKPFRIEAAEKMVREVLDAQDPP